MSTPNTLNGGKTPFSLQDLLDALADTSEHQRPVESWNPTLCGDIDIIIRADGAWWHEGSPMTRPAMVRLFASILRKDDDGVTYLVTPVEKLAITLERAHFVAIRVDVQGEGQAQRLFFTTNLDEVVEAGADHPIRVETDSATQEPSPFVAVRGRLEAAISRSTFYELVEMAVERETDAGTELGVWAGDVFFPLGPAGIQDD